MLEDREPLMTAPSSYPPTEAETKVLAFAPRCRLCSAPLQRTFLDLGAQPLCESYLDEAGLHAPEVFYPLRTYVCERCLLVQAEDFATPDQIFREYAYFSSYSRSWLEHARRFSEHATERLGLGPGSFVLEIASNDGYLLRNFVDRGIPVLGVDPARNVAEVAVANGVPTLAEFFGTDLAMSLASTGRKADLIVANNVLAHVPDLHDFVGGIASILAPHGRASLEFPHLLRLIAERQFDTIYHEHFSYLTLAVTDALFAQHGLQVVDVDTLPTHGGSLRLWVAHLGEVEPTAAVGMVLASEKAAQLDRLEGYVGFEEEVRTLKRRLLRLLFDLHEQGQRVAGYGAPGKGNTLLNYCGIREDLLPYTVDRNPYKQGKYLPGTRIPVYPLERLEADRPDVIVILPWNLKHEIITQLEPARSRGARFLVPIPEPMLLAPSPSTAAG